MRGLSDEYGSWKTIWIRRRCARVALGRQPLAGVADLAGRRARRGRRCSGRASTCRSRTRRRARASRPWRSRDRRRRPRAAPPAAMPGSGAARVAASDELHRAGRAARAAAVRHRRSPALGARRRRTRRRGCTRSRGPAGAERPQREVAASGSPPARTGSADGSGSPAAARPGRAAAPGIDDERLADEVEVAAPSAAGRACTGAAARGTPRRPCPSRRPGRRTSRRRCRHVCAITARSCETNTTLTPKSLLQRPRAA